jgi:flagellar hook-associated protein 2
MPLSGIASGLDSTALIQATLDVEAIPQAMLKSKVSASQALTAALTTLNGRVASLTTLAQGISKPAALSLLTATSTSPVLTAKASAGAMPAELQVTVDRTAAKHTAVTAAMSVWPENPPALTLTKPDGSSVPVTAASNSLDDVVKALNASGAGVTATKVPAGKDASGTDTFRLQLTATTTGAAAAFDLKDSTGTSVFSAPTAGIVQQGTDAQVTLYAGTPAEQKITSATNTFTGILPGVDATVTAPSAGPVTLTVGTDSDGISKKAADLVEALNSVFNNVKVSTMVTPGVGGAKTTAGILQGDSAVRSVNMAILSAATMPVNGVSPSEYGISITKSGTVEYDAEKFKAALAKDPAAVNAAVQTIAGRVADAGKTASDPYEGTITRKITTQQGAQKDLGNQIGDWDRRLAGRKASLTKLYANLEVNMGRLNAQMSQLANSLSALEGSQKTK